MALLSIFGPSVVKAIDSVKDDLVEAVKGAAKDGLDKWTPFLISAAERQLEKYGPQLMQIAKDELKERFDEWMPILTAGLSKVVLEGMKSMVVGGTDKLTDLTPTEVDDKIVDPIVDHVMNEWLPGLFSGLFTPKPR